MPVEVAPAAQRPWSLHLSLYFDSEAGPSSQTILNSGAAQQSVVCLDSSDAHSVITGFLGRSIRLVWFVEMPPTLGWAGGDTMAVSLRMAGLWLEGWDWLRQVASEEGSGVSSGFHAAAAGTQSQCSASIWCEAEQCRGGAELGGCWLRQDLVCWGWGVVGDMEAFATLVDLIRSLWSGTRPTFLLGPQFTSFTASLWPQGPISTS